MDEMINYSWCVLNEATTLVKSAEDLRPIDNASPFSTLKFLSLLEQSASVGNDTGWVPHHFCLYEHSESSYADSNGGSIESNMPNGKLIAFIPCYQKSHSYGEYVFDHAWANAFHQHGISYYPKLLCAIPFTPVSTSKVLVSQDSQLTESEIVAHWWQHNQSIIKKYSSVHALFLTQNSRDTLEQLQFHERLNVQFVFYNSGYQSFDDFLTALKSRKRKTINKERKALTRQDITIKRLSSGDINSQIMADFYKCYQVTYIKRSGHHGYLTEAFFSQLLKEFAENILIVAAFKNTTMIASALFFYDDNSLFGRYWGALEDVSGLHFECCYYQGIEFAIERQHKIFNPGTQGEHKILRGFTPTLCHSMHKIQHVQFDEAVGDFVRRERPHMLEYLENTKSLLPFRAEK
ncbi:GNAT family N-acetyltransferase [Agaribacter marinus]|uniref:GNAT family N-acetyltransferase n=1 Tax=Agaribacter marinus TaxID=1431249 RepID=A0AA37WGX3_9ALTE|nr:GNAT family N-acetyltransferase [Agaribacter marinus]GLR70681.1 hypothetical protein GCM10007852_15890 [Agaribacter marinus]